MKLDGVALEIQALKTIRGRWQTRGWKFTPLERLDGENEIIESLYLLRDSPICWPSFDFRALDSNTERLLDDLEDIYGRAAQAWEEFKTVVGCERSQSEFSRWPYGTYPAKIRREVRYRFWELVTTSRFSINDIPNIAELQQVNFPVPPLKARHVASIATMVCVKEAIVALEAIISSWIAASRTRCGGKPFKWLVEHDPDRLELILCELLKESHEREFYNEQFRDAWDSKKQGERWLAHLDALDFNEANLERSVEAAKVKILAQLKAQNSSRASDAAKSKNSEARAWVLDKWESRTDRGESKAAFARQYASLVKGKFKLAITSDTIQRDWLPKVEK